MSEQEGIDRLQKHFEVGAEEWTQLACMLKERTNKVSNSLININHVWTPETVMKHFWKEVYEEFEDAISFYCNHIEQYYDTYEDEEELV